jgi:hypothetical protein
MKIKPKCQSCKCIFLGGQGGLCEFCLSGKTRLKKAKPLRCLCGKKAVVVILATVLTPEEEPLELEIPLCRDCRDLEGTLEKAPGFEAQVVATDPEQIVIVKSLPRARQSYKGRIL